MNGLKLDMSSSMLGTFTSNSFCFQVESMDKTNEAIQLLVENNDNSFRVVDSTFTHVWSVKEAITVPSINYEKLLDDKKKSLSKPYYKQPNHLEEKCFPFGRFSKKAESPKKKSKKLKTKE